MLTAGFSALVRVGLAALLPLVCSKPANLLREDQVRIHLALRHECIMRPLLRLALLWVGFLSIAAAGNGDWKAVATLPSNAIATAVVKVDDTNPAMQNLFNILVNDYFGAELPSFLQQNILFLLSGDVAVAMTGAASPEAVDYAIVTDYIKDRMQLTLPLGDVKINLAGDDPEKMKKLYGWLFGTIFDELLARDQGTLYREALPGGELTFNPEGEDDSDPSAYTLVGSKAILGSNSRVVKQLAHHLEQPGGGLADNPLFAELQGRIPPGTHGFVFVDNRNQQFGRFLRHYEQELDRTLLRTAELLDGMMMTFTLVDQKRLKGHLWLVPLDGISLEVLEGGAVSLDEIAGQELERMGLAFSSKIAAGKGALEMEFTIEDLRKPSENQ